MCVPGLRGLGFFAGASRLLDAQKPWTRGLRCAQLGCSSPRPVNLRRSKGLLEHPPVGLGVRKGAARAPLGAPGLGGAFRAPTRCHRALTGLLESTSV